MNKKIEIMKVFDCQDMTEDLRHSFFDMYEKGNDVYVIWTIETSGINDLSEDFGEDTKETDQWLIDNGAESASPGKDGETVLIQHWW